MKFNWWPKKKTKTAVQAEELSTDCGRVIDAMPTDYAWQLPDEVWALGEEERQAHLDWSSDVSHYEHRWFLRGVLETPFLFAEGCWGWGCWAEVDDETLGRYWNLGGKDGSKIPPQPGRLACEIPGYPGSIGLPVALQFGPPDKRPLIYLPPDCEHDLALAQRSGLSEADYQVILKAIGG